MADLVHHNCHDLISALDRMASSPKLPPCHWISTPDGDQGSEWCYCCGRAMVRHLRRQDRRRRGDYILDGGWRTDHDHRVFCAGCGCQLDGSLTTYGALEELDYFRDLDPASASNQDAYDLSEVLLTLDVTSEDDADAALEAIAIARRIVEAKPSPQRDEELSNG
jgi:hypothetical protein